MWSISSSKNSATSCCCIRSCAIAYTAPVKPWSQMLACYHASNACVVKKSADFCLVRYPKSTCSFQMPCRICLFVVVLFVDPSAYRSKMCRCDSQDILYHLGISCINILETSARASSSSGEYSECQHCIVRVSSIAPALPENIWVQNACVCSFDRFVASDRHLFSRCHFLSCSVVSRRFVYCN